MIDPPFKLHGYSDADLERFRELISSAPLFSERERLAAEGLRALVSAHGRHELPLRPPTPKPEPSPKLREALAAAQAHLAGRIAFYELALNASLALLTSVATGDVAAARDELEKRVREQSGVVEAERLVAMLRAIAEAK